MSDWYILGPDHEPVASTVEEWSAWLGHGFPMIIKRVANDNIGDTTVSTVFLGVDHNWGDGPPILFETMVFGGDHDEWQWRYHTWDEAAQGHAAVVAAVKGEGLWPDGR